MPGRADEQMRHTDLVLVRSRREPGTLRSGAGAAPGRGPGTGHPRHGEKSKRRTLRVYVVYIYGNNPYYHLLLVGLTIVPISIDHLSFAFSSACSLGGTCSAPCTSKWAQITSAVLGSC
jgi:hypothetical protein